MSGSFEVEGEGTGIDEGCDMSERRVEYGNGGRFGEVR